MKKTDYFKEWSDKAIISTRFEWWIKKLQFWRYREIAKGMLLDTSTGKGGRE